MVRQITGDTDMPETDSPEVKKLRSEFREAHKQWVEVNNPEGFETGTVRRYCNKRINVLLKLVRAQQDSQDT